MTNKKRNTKKEMESFQKQNTAQRKALAEKQAAKKSAKKNDAAKAHQWAQKQIAEDAKKEEEGKKQIAAFALRQKEERKEYEEFRKKKDDELQKTIDEKEKQKKEREKHLAYLKEMSNKNRWAIQKEKKKQDAENKKNTMKVDADRDASRTKLQATSEERRVKKSAEKVAEKERGKADIYENEHSEIIRQEARSAQQKLKVKERTDNDALDGKIARETAIAERYQNPYQKTSELRRVANMERSERKKIRQKYIKLEQDIEVQANTKIAQIKKEASMMRNKATMEERKEKLRIENETRQKKNNADKDAAHQKIVAEQTEKDIMSGEIPYPLEEDS